MKRKNIMHLAICIFAGAMLTTSVTFAQQSQGKTAEMQKQEAIYTCPMHPEVTRNVPGKCPKCGMELVMQKERKDKPMNEQGDTLYMKHGHMMHDSAEMHHQYMMNDSTKGSHQQMMYEPAKSGHQKMVNDSTMMMHHQKK